MANSRFSRQYRKILDEALGPAGFLRRGSSYLRECNGLVDMVALHRSNPWNFTGDFAVVPLVYPDSGIGFGDRIDELPPDCQSWWPTPDPEDTDQLRRVIRGYAQTVVSYVLPWFEHFNRLSDLIHIDQCDAWFSELQLSYLGFGPGKKELILGICALAENDAKSARAYLNVARREYTAHPIPDRPSADWIRADLALLEFYLDCLRMGDWEGIRTKIAEGEAYMRRELGLDKIPS